MKVNNLKDIENSLSNTRAEFHKTTKPIRGILDDVFDLYFEVSKVIGENTRDVDEETYVLEVLAVSFRRVVGSLVLLESGLPQEAHNILRNALEFMLIGIDIAHNRDSLEEWKKTVNDDLKSDSLEDWYFKKFKICKRVEVNENNVYPELERKLVLGVENAIGYGICKEWERISNMSVHAHSQAQIKKLFDGKGNFQLLGRKTKENYKKDFIQYRIFIFNIVTILLGIPKYEGLIKRDKSIVNKYMRVQDSMK